MSAKDKAIELVTKYAELEYGCNDNIVFSKMHKKQALIAVDEMIKQEISLLGLSEKYVPTWWNWVKQEIQLL